MSAGRTRGRWLLVAAAAMVTTAACHPTRPDAIVDAGTVATIDAARSDADTSAADDASVEDASAADAAGDASADAEVDAHVSLEEDPHPPRSWEDPRVLAGLAASCSFTPWDSEEEEGHLAFSCQGDMPEQSCTYDPCQDKADKCKPGCAKTCERCDVTCGKTCDACEKACTDGGATSTGRDAGRVTDGGWRDAGDASDAAVAGDAGDAGPVDCRMACALQTAQCKTACAQGRDRCVTAGCSDPYSDCRAAIDAIWESHGCAKLCPVLTGCVSSCGGDLDSKCGKKCRAAYAVQCPGELTLMCMGNGPWMSDEDIARANGQPWPPADAEAPDAKVPASTVDATAAPANSTSRPAASSSTPRPRE